MRYAAVAMLLLIGCDVATEPPAGRFEFSLQRVATVNFQDPKLAVIGGDGEIRVEGEHWAACAGGTLKGSLRESDPSTFAIVVQDQGMAGDACFTAVTPYEYDAILGGLAPGRYHLQVLYNHVSGQTVPRTVFHDFIEVH